MTSFAGFEMPVQYSGIIQEHLAVRSAAGLFDLSHMGEFEVTGPKALELLERALTNSAARLNEQHAQYTLLCAEDGGTIDDLIVYRTGASRYLLCVNASNIDVDREWLNSLNKTGADFRDLSDETALVAVQGPKAVGLVSAMATFPAEKVPRFGLASGEVAGVRCLAARTGYTGEDGFELFVDSSQAERLFGALLDAGAEKIGMRPCGLGARDTLRLEASLPLYGHELDRSTTPLEAGLGAFVKLGRGFVGEAAITERKSTKRLVGVVTDDRKSIARQGYPVSIAGREAGVVTSGTFAPSLGRPVAMAYVQASETVTIGGQVEIGVRNRKVPATITALPFYKREAS